MNVLLVYASTHGHTGRIAHRIAHVLLDSGHRVSLRRVDDAPVSLSRWDAVVVGGSVHNGKHQRELVTWAHEHHRALAALPNAFFSVSLSAAKDTPKAREAARRCIDRFVEDTEWDPHHSAAIAGSLQYTEYDRKTRLVMQEMMRLGGYPTDTSRDHEMTDWDAVEAFARDFAAQLNHQPVAA